MALTPRRKPGHLHQLTCLTCSTAFSNKMSHAKYCRSKCQPRKVVARGCVECGKTFETTNRTAKCCGSECANKLREKSGAEATKAWWDARGRKHASRADAYKLYGYKRRAVVRSRHAEKIIADQIFERDGWICQICVEEIDRSLEWPHPRSVSLDHIVPVSRGGQHTVGNVQCAHLCCNSSKGAKPALAA
jgi:hypothetical protein